MNKFEKKNIRKISGTRNRYKPGQLVTIDNCVFRIVRELCSEDLFNLLVSQL